MKFKPLINILILLLAITFGCKKRDEKPPLSDENLITEFAFRKSINGSLAVDIVAEDITGTEIELKVPFSTNLFLIPTIVISDGATISPDSGVRIDFEKTNPTTYIVTAENGDEQEYKVTVTKLPGSSENLITSYVFEAGKNGFKDDVDAGEIEGTNIELTVPFGTALELTPTIEISDGATISPESGVGINFEETNPTTYTVTAENGEKQEYNVTVEVAQNTECEIKTFVFEAGKNGFEDDVDAGEIEGTNIELTVPFGTALELTPTIEISDGATINPASGVPINFEETNPTTYTVTAENGEKQEYNVTVTEAPASSECEIKTFVFEAGNNQGILGKDIDGDITGTDITVTVPFGTDVEALLVATFTVSNGATVTVDGEQQISGETEVNFTNAVTYTVTSQNEAFTQNYEVTVTIKPQPSFATVSYYERENRVGAGDFEKPDLFEISDIAEGSYNYTLKIADKTANGTVEVKDGNGTIRGSKLSISDWKSIPNGNVDIELTIEGSTFSYNTTKEQYNIKSWQDLQGIKDNLGGRYTLMNDIELPEPSQTGGTFPEELPKEGFNPLGNAHDHFTGTLDGNGYVIKNFFIDRENKNYVGLFGYTNISTNNNYNINNVGIEISDGGVTGLDYVGGLVGFVYTGGLFATNCYVTGNVTGRNHVGGLVGTLDRSSVVNNCYTTGNVTGNNYVGGLVGVVGNSFSDNHGKVYRSYATGNVKGTGNEGYAGGLVGRFFRGDIEDSYATGNVEGIQRVGGFFGRLHDDALVKRCYATGKVTGVDDSSTGGFGGDQGNNSTTNSYWDMASAEQGDRSSAGTGVSAASNLRKTEGKYYDTGQDPDAEVFVNWEFGTSDSEPWKWDDNGGKWPTLYWQYTN